MEITEKERGKIIFESLTLLQKRFEQEVKAETKYSEPLMRSQKFKLLAGWKFTEYVKTN